MKTRSVIFVAALAALSIPALAQTTQSAPAANPPADSAKKPDAVIVAPVVVAPATAPMNSRTRMKAEHGEKDKLEEALKAGQNRADYRSIIEKHGYKVSAINADKPDYLEYEIVKGKKSYEVQLDFKDNAPKATKVDVTTNMWQAEGTEKMLKDEKYAHASPLAADPEGRYSDRRYMKDWTGEKDKLEKALAGPMKPADYLKKLADMGYKVTSVNDKEKDYVEYEIVKGKNSYEVQIDLDPATQMGKKVDVETNVWETDSTERAKGEK
ncbi:MAG: hypothetical protein ABI589_00685 [Burkholderiales bacterium]